MGIITQNEQIEILRKDLKNIKNILFLIEGRTSLAKRLIKEGHELRNMDIMPLLDKEINHEKINIIKEMKKKQYHLIKLTE